MSPTTSATNCMMPARAATGSLARWDSDGNSATRPTYSPSSGEYSVRYVYTCPQQDSNLHKSTWLRRPALYPIEL